MKQATCKRPGVLVGLALALSVIGAAAQPGSAVDRWPVDREVVARIREEGLQRSQLPGTFSYMTDVLGARLTNSQDMDRAQQWVIDEMHRIGLVNAAREPFMNYGVSWVYRVCIRSYAHTRLSAIGGLSYRSHAEH